MVFTDLLNRISNKFSSNQPTPADSPAESAEAAAEGPSFSDISVQRDESEAKANETNIKGADQSASSSKIQVEPSITEAVKNFNEEDWRKFAKENPNVVKIITDLANQEEETVLNSIEKIKNDTSSFDLTKLQDSADAEAEAKNEVIPASESRNIFVSTKDLILTFIDKSLHLLNSIFSRIQKKLTPENIQLLSEILHEILQSFAFTENNRDNSVVVALILKGLADASNVPSIKEIPNLTIFLTVLTVLIKVSSVIYKISFDADQQVLREKIKRLFQ